MDYTPIPEILSKTADYMDKKVSVAGFVKTVRHSKTVRFIEINDGLSLSNLQILSFEDTKAFEDAGRIGVGASVFVSGTLTRTENAKQKAELHADEIAILGDAPSDYPLQKKRHSFEYLRTIAHLRPRSNTFGAVFRIRSAAAFAIHEFFNSRNFTYVHTPIITGNDAEGAGEMFSVTTLDPAGYGAKKNADEYYADDFFGKKAGLTVSGQLEAEAFALAFSRVYTFGPTFRAENSNTPRHAAEFWMIEPEIAFADLMDDMALAKDMLVHVVRAVLSRRGDDIDFCDQFIEQGLKDRLQALVNTGEFAHITYTEAIGLLEQAPVKFEYPVSWGCDLQTEHERYITEQIYGKPVFVTDYPKEIKAFYMRENDDGKTVAAMDMLVPGVGELIGGSQREERFNKLKARMEELHLPEEEYGWYLDLRRFGGVPHAGFGLGFERLIMYLTGMKNIRDVIAFPRNVGSIEF